MFEHPPVISFRQLRENDQLGAEPVDEFARERLDQVGGIRGDRGRQTLAAEAYRRARLPLPQVLERPGGHDKDIVLQDFCHLESQVFLRAATFIRVILERNPRRHLPVQQAVNLGAQVDVPRVVAEDFVDFVEKDYRVLSRLL